MCVCVCLCVHSKVGHAMIQSAKEVLNQYLSAVEEEKDVRVKTHMVPETASSAFGNGSGVM